MLILSGINKKNILLYLLMITTSLTIVGCSNILDKLDTGEEKTSEIKNPDAEEVLTMDPKADIIQYNGIVYKTNIDWVDKLELTKDEQIGEIKKKNSTDTNFEDEMSNKLPIGAKIFSVKEENEVDGPILIIESEGEYFNYYGLVEG